LLHLLHRLLCLLHRHLMYLSNRPFLGRLLFILRRGVSLDGLLVILLDGLWLLHGRVCWDSCMFLLER
jgi:hypothetical protein